MNRSEKIQNKEDLVLAALSVRECGFEYSLVQIQKILFLLDDRIGEKLNIRKMFNFVPYDFGPYDKNINSTLKNSNEKGVIKIIPGNHKIGYQRYALTEKGHKKGQQKLNAIPKELRTYIVKLTNWVVNRSFQELIRAIYIAYPHMQENSVFTKSANKYEN